MFGGQIAARNIKLVPSKRVVQALRTGNWENGLYSGVRFELHADGDNTKMVSTTPATRKKGMTYLRAVSTKFIGSHSLNTSARVHSIANMAIFPNDWGQ